MGIFSRKRPDDEAAVTPEQIAGLAVQRFAEHRIDVRVDPATSGNRSELVDATGGRFPLHNLIVSIPETGVDLARVVAAVDAHVDSLVGGLRAPNAQELSHDDLLWLVRVRLMPEAAREQMSMSYARSVVPGLIAVLCVDHPSHVEYLSDDALQGRDVEELFARGLRNVIEEPFGADEEVAPGVRLLAGNSFFTASKVIGMSQLAESVFAPAPHGVVFAVPHRHVIYAHVVTAENVLTAVNAIASLAAENAGEDAPGGPLSSSAYYWRGGVTEVLSVVTDDGRIHVLAEGRFVEMLEEVLG